MDHEILAPPREVSVILVSEIATAGTERSVAEEEFMTGGGVDHGKAGGASNFLGTLLYLVWSKNGGSNEN